MITHDYNSNIQMLLDTEKSGFGCSWSASKGSICAHGNSCPFTTKILELDQIPHSTISDQVSKPPQRLHNVVVLKQTPHGLVKVPDSMIPQHQLDKFRGLHNPRPQDNSSAGPYISNYSRSQTLPIVSRSGSSNFYRPPATYQTAPPEQSRLMDISNTRMLYRPPANSFLVKVPPLSQSSNSTVLLCSDCDTQFADNKSLVKHTRNQHQVYQCSKCGESTVGYYRMASHTKRNHSKEPVFFCNCGRNFSEKRGLTKHQNSCTFYHS